MAHSPNTDNGPLNPEQSTFWSEGLLASPSPSPDSAKDSTTPAATSPSSFLDWLISSSPDGSSGKTCQVSSVQRVDGTLVPSSGALVELGYGFAYRVLDAQHFGVPQRRRRVFVVACLGDWRAPAEVLLESDCVRRDPKKGRAKGQGSAAGAEGGVGADHPEGCWRDGGQVSQTLDAVLQKGQTMPEKNRFPAVLQPLSHWDGSDVHPTLNQSAKGSGGVGASNQELFSQGGAYLVPGQPIPFRMSKRACSTTDNETWVEADASNTLNNFDLGDTRTTHAVVEPFAWTQNQREEVRILGDKTGALALPGTHQSNYIAEQKVYENHPNDSRVTGPLDVSPTVVSRFGTGGGNVPLVNNEPVTFQPGNLRRDAGADPSTTTTTTLKKGGNQHGVLTPMAVRRLTPVECERLQGFPDNWSRISWKGKPEDQCPDGPRYKACGNSMAVPVMRWIGERIAAADAKHFPHA